MANFYIGDPHFGHSNIIKYDNRPFNTPTAMDETLIRNWNNRIKDTDTVFILGDISWYKDYENNARILSRLNGNKILIKGNHDHVMKKCREFFTEVLEYKRITDYVNGKETVVILFHYPIMVWDNQFHDSIHLYAHVHNSQQHNMFESTLAEWRALQALPMRAYNVGCMHPWMDYTPRTLEEIINTYPKLEVKDH